MYTKFIAAVLLTFAGLTHADDALDWKLYAFSQPSNALFYLSSDIERKGDHVLVWAKALPTEKLNTVDSPVEGNIKKMVDSIARLISQGYEPPLATIKTMERQELLMTITYEQMADAGVVDPTIKILYEIDCGQKLMRTLSIMTPTVSDSTVGQWEHIAPESPLATLRKLTCKPH